MNSKILLYALNNIDDKMILEADKTHRKKPKMNRYAFAAACFSILLLASFAVFYNHDSVTNAYYGTLSLEDEAVYAGGGGNFVDLIKMNNRIYAIDLEGFLYSVDRTDGIIKTGMQFPSGETVYEDNGVLYYLEDNQILCYDILKNSVASVYRLSGGDGYDLLWANHSILIYNIGFQSEDGLFYAWSYYALDLNTGTVKTLVERSKDYLNLFASADTVIAFFNSSSTFVGTMDIETGQISTLFEWGDAYNLAQVYPYAQIIDGYLYYGIYGCGIFRVPLNGEGSVETIVTNTSLGLPCAFTWDGDHFLVVMTDDENKSTVCSLDLDLKRLTPLEHQPDTLSIVNKIVADGSYYFYITDIIARIGWGQI